MLLKIKAEALMSDVSTFRSNQIALLALIFSVVGVVWSMLSNMSSNVGNGKALNIVCLFYIGILFFSTIKIGFLDKYNNVSKWREYVLIVLDEMLADKNKKKNKNI